MVSDLKQKRKLNHVPHHPLAIHPPVNHSAYAIYFSALLLDNWTIISSDMLSALFTGRSDRTLQCVLPLFWKTQLPSSKALTYRQLQPGLKLIGNSHSFYRVNRRCSSGWMSCLETTARNSQLCWLHSQVWGELSYMVWGFFFGVPGSI